MATTVVLARYLTVDEYGVYNLILGSLVVFSLVTNWGLGSALQRFIPEYARTQQYGRLFKTFFFSQSFRGITGICAIFLAVVCFERVARLLHVEEYKHEYILFCIGAFALFQLEFLQIAFNGLLLQKYSAFGQVGYLALRLLLVAVLLSAGGKLASVFVSELSAYIAICLVMWYLFIKQVYLPLRPQMETSAAIEKSRVWRYSLLSAATIPGSFLFSHAMDYFVVAAMATTTQLGIYALASRASNMLLSIMPQNVMQTLVRPVFFQQYCSVKDKHRELNRMFRAIMLMIAAFLFPVLTIIGTQADSILSYVFQSKYAESTPIFLTFIAFSAFTILEMPSDLVLQAIEKVQARLYAQIFAVYNLVAAILLMRNFGVLGVAFATGSALVGKCVFWYLMARFYTGITIPVKSLLKIALNSALAAIVAFRVGSCGHSPVWMFSAIGAGGAVYLMLSWVNNFMNQDDKILANKFCKRNVFRV